MFYREANDYFYFHLEDKKSFTRNVSNNRFVLQIYYDNDNMINLNDQIKIIKDLTEEYKLG